MRAKKSAHNSAQGEEAQIGIADLVEVLERFDRGEGA